MTVSYRFRKFKLESGSYIKRPAVNIILKKESKSLEMWAILDSGSDITTIPRAIADFLELKIEDEESEMMGYKGSGIVRHSKVTIIFKGKMQRIDEVLHNVPIAVMQDYDGEDGAEVVVGTQGVFEHFKILFNDSKNVSLTRIV